jgi:hypothetical protein
MDRPPGSTSIPSVQMGGLSRPKKQGGWGFRKLPLFNLALIASTLWRVLNHPSIWKQVIFDKYLHNSQLSIGFRHHSHQCRPTSKIWTSLRRALPVINHWTSWRPGSSLQVKIGRDTILDLGDRAQLSEDLLSTLKHRGILTLAQASTGMNLLTHTEIWKSPGDLRLVGNQALEWNRYTASLGQAGVTLQQTKKDKLLWNGGDSSGEISVRNCYKAILSLLSLPNLHGWKLKLWKWNLQLKIILFFRLAADQNILTWDNLLKKGWVGPGFCYLCRAAAEDNAHLFIHCHFTKAIWNFLY